MGNAERERQDAPHEEAGCDHDQAVAGGGRISPGVHAERPEDGEGQEQADDEAIGKVRVEAPDEAGPDHWGQRARHGIQ